MMRNYVLLMLTSLNNLFLVTCSPSDPLHCFVIISDSGIMRRIVNVIYTDCIRQCTGPMYVVSTQSGPQLMYCYGTDGRRPPVDPVLLLVDPLRVLFSGSYGAAGDGEHRQLVSVSLFTLLSQCILYLFSYGHLCDIYIVYDNE